MWTKKIVAVLPLLVLFATCKKQKYPDSVVLNEPVYYSEMDINGRGIKINAGENNYYQYSSYAQDSDMVYVLKSELANTTCRNCAEAIEFNFHDIKKSGANALITPDSILKVGSKSFVREGRTPAYTVEYRASYNLPTVSDNITWDFGDGKIGKGYLVSHTYEFANTYNVCLSAKGINSCLSTLCNRVDVSGNTPMASISHTNFADSANFKAIVSNGTAPYTYLWDFGDGSRSAQAAPAHTYKTTGSYPVSLTIKDSKGKSNVFYYNFVSGNDKSSCAGNYSVSAVSVAPNGSQNWNKIVLQYRGANGVLYSSAKIDQKETASFEIVSVTDAGTNENGDKLKKVEIKYSALVSNGIETLEIKNGKGIIAVAYK